MKATTLTMRRMIIFLQKENNVRIRQLRGCAKSPVRKAEDAILFLVWAGIIKKSKLGSGAQKVYNLTEMGREIR